MTKGNQNLRISKSTPDLNGNNDSRDSSFVINIIQNNTTNNNISIFNCKNDGNGRICSSSLWSMLYENKKKLPKLVIAGGLSIAVSGMLAFLAKEMEAGDPAYAWFIFFCVFSPNVLMTYLYADKTIELFREVFTQRDPLLIASMLFGAGQSMLTVAAGISLGYDSVSALPKALLAIPATAWVIINALYTAETRFVATTRLTYEALMKPLRKLYRLYLSENKDKDAYKDLFQLVSDLNRFKYHVDDVSVINNEDETIDGYKQFITEFYTKLISTDGLKPKRSISEKILHGVGKFFDVFLVLGVRFPVSAANLYLSEEGLRRIHLKIDNKFADAVLVNAASLPSDALYMMSAYKVRNEIIALNRNLFLNIKRSASTHKALLTAAVFVATGSWAVFDYFSGGSGGEIVNQRTGKGFGEVFENTWGKFHPYNVIFQYLKSLKLADQSSLVTLAMFYAGVIVNFRAMINFFSKTVQSCQYPQEEGMINVENISKELDTVLNGSSKGIEKFGKSNLILLAQHAKKERKRFKVTSSGIFATGDIESRGEQDENTPLMGGSGIAENVRLNYG